MANNQEFYGFPQPISQIFPAPIIAARAPTTSDIKYPIGQQWVDTVGDDAYILVDVTAGVATWNVTATTPGNVDTLTGDSGGAITPSAGDIGLKGTANQITTTGSGHNITWTLPSAITAPGSLTTTTSLASTTTMTCGTGLTVTTGGITVSAGTTTLAALTQVGTASINASGAGVTTIGTGGTGAVNIGNATGNTAVTGSLTASTTLTATLGAITATNGNLVLGTAGNKIISTSVASTTTAGANSFGKVTLVAGTATISTTAVTANSIIMLTRDSIGSTGAAALGMLTVGTKSAGASFVINSLTTADATAVATTDVSSVSWMIIN